MFSLPRALVAGAGWFELHLNPSSRRKTHHFAMGLEAPVDSDPVAAVLNGGTEPKESQESKDSQTASESVLITAMFHTLPLNIHYLATSTLNFSSKLTRAKLSHMYVQSRNV